MNNHRLLTIYFGKAILLLIFLTTLMLLLSIILISSCHPGKECDNGPIRENSPILDQFTPLTTNDPFSYNIEAFKPMGQSFVPTFHALDYVALFLDDASCSSSGDEGGNLFVRIRKLSFDGEIIGESNPLHFDNCFVGVKQFEFPHYIELIPGQVYFIEPVYLSGDTSTIFISLDSMFYTKGAFYLNGIEQSNGDMIFQEGIFYSLPSSKCDCINNFENVIGPTGLPFSSRGDCFRFLTSRDVLSS